MICHTCQLDKTIWKISQDLTLWTAEKGLVKINQNSLAVPIKQNNREKGYIFHGEGKLVLDAIIETVEGAIGKSIEEELKDPFLMLGHAEKINAHLDTATQEDLMRMKYKDEQEVISKAQKLFEQFLGKKKICKNHGVIFAFPNKIGKLDILIAKGSKIVYKTTATIFIANKDKMVLKTPQKIILSKHKKCLVIT